MHRSSIGSTDCGAKLLCPGILTRLLILIQFERWPSEYMLLHQNLSGVSILWGRGKMAANVECRIRYHTGYISQLFKTSRPRHSRVGDNELNGPYLYLFCTFDLSLTRVRCLKYSWNHLDTFQLFHVPCIWCWICCSRRSSHQILVKKCKTESSKDLQVHLQGFYYKHAKSIGQNMPALRIDHEH